MMACDRSIEHWLVIGPINGWLVIGPMSAGL